MTHKVNRVLCKCEDLVLSPSNGERGKQKGPRACQPASLVKQQVSVLVRGDVSRSKVERNRKKKAIINLCCIHVYIPYEHQHYVYITPYLSYQIITLSDLECDYINARSCCSKLNKWVIPELVGHTIVTVLMLVSLHWVIFLLNLPVATWNIYRFIMVPSGNMGVFDPTEIHNRGQLKSHMKEAMIKLGFYLLCFFMYLYSMILALIND